MTELEACKKEIERLQQQIAYKESFESALIQISLQFLAPANFSHAVDFALIKILECSGADRAVIMQINPKDPTLISMTHEKCRTGVGSVKKQAQNQDHSKNKWFRKMHELQGFVAITNIANLPAEAQAEKELMEKNRIGASLIASFSSDGRFIGNIGIHNTQQVQEWNEEVVNLVRQTAVLIEHTLKRVHAEEELVEAKIRAEQSDKLKSNFLANLSHELRTPLNGIMGFTKLLLTRSFSGEKQAEFANLVDSNSRRLLTVINDLLDISRIESNNIHIQNKEVNINDLLSALFKQFNLVGHKKSEIVFELDIPREQEALFVLSDPLRLKQILENFLNNAFKYTQSGYVRLGYSMKPKHLHIYVEDSGQGISRKHLPHIFDRFWEIESTDVRNFGGNGLGLSISRDLAQMMGGEIRIKSKPGKGSTFTLCLPSELIVPKPQQEPNLHHDASRNHLGRV